MSKQSKRPNAPQPITQQDIQQMTNEPTVQKLIDNILNASHEELANVHHVKAQIKNGTFKIDYEALTDKLIEFEFSLAENKKKTVPA